METIELAKAEAEQQEKSSLAIVVDVKGLVITDNDTYHKSAEYLQIIKGQMDKIEKKRKEMTTPLDAAKKAIMAFFKKPMDMLEEAENTIKSSMGIYNRKLETERLEKEAALRKAQEAEARRLEGIAKRTTDEAKKAELQAQAAITREIQPVVATQAPKVEGISEMIVWGFKITDLNAIPREYMIPNETMLGQIARSTKGALKIAGVEFTQTKVIKSSKK